MGYFLIAIKKQFLLSILLFSLIINKAIFMPNIIFFIFLLSFYCIFPSFPCLKNSFFKNHLSFFSIKQSISIENRSKKEKINAKKHWFFLLFRKRQSFTWFFFLSHHAKLHYFSIPYFCNFLKIVDWFIFNFSAIL